jgi:hypothetical protein
VLQKGNEVRKIVFVAAIAVSAAACSDANEVEKRVRFVATGMQAVTPKELGHGVMLTSARAEGRTLVLAFRGLGGRDAKIVSTELKQVACNDRNMRGLIDEGGALRFEMTTFARGHARGLLPDD